MTPSEGEQWGRDQIYPDRYIHRIFPVISPVLSNQDASAEHSSKTAKDRRFIFRFLETDASQWRVLGRSNSHMK